MNENFRLYTAYARIDGAIIGAMWIASFFCFIGEFQLQVLNIVAIVLGLTSVFAGYTRLRKFRDEVLGGSITFSCATLYTILIFFYASLLMAVAQYIYFQFIDQGYLMNQYISTLSQPEYAKVVKEVYGMDAKQIITLLQTTISTLRPIEIAFQFLTLNIILGIFLSIPIGALARRIKNI